MKRFLSVIIVLVLFLCSHIALAAPFLYITNHDSNTVSVIDTATNTVVATIPVGNYPTGIAVDYLGTHAYTANALDGTISVIDTTTNTVTATISRGIHPIGVALNPNGTRLYMTDVILNSVFVIDTVANAMVAIIPVGGGPQGVVVSSDGKIAYVANTNDNTVTVIETATNTVIATITVGNGPVGVDVTPDSSLVIVADQNTVSLISAATNTVVATVPGGTNAEGVAIVPGGTRAYITDFSSNNVLVIDTATNTVVATIPVGTNPLGVAVSPDGKWAYVTNRGNNTVSVIDTATNTVATTIPVGNGPIALGKSIGPSMMPVPVAASVLSSSPYAPVVDPILSPFPFNAMPFAIGELSSGNLNFSTGFVSFAGHVDIFLAYRFSGDPTKIKNLNPDHSFTSLSLSDVAHALSSGLPPAGVVPWKQNTTGPVSEALFGLLPLLGLPPGTYTIYVLVTPSGTLAQYYLWTTDFVVPVPIGGDIVTDNFLIAEGETRLATSDLTVRATKSIQIDGTLLVNEGVNVALLSDGPLTINGKMKPNVTASSLVGAAKADGQRIAQQATVAVSWFGYGSDVTFMGNSTFPSPGVTWITSRSNGTVTINGNVFTQDGIDGTNANRDGGDSASIELGTDAAFQAVKSRCPDCTPAGRPAKVIIAGILKTGRGGAGYDDIFGSNTYGTTTPQVYLGGNGGKAGNISISASDTIDLTGAALTAGDGGWGGQAGHGVRSSDGKNNGDPGRDIMAATGSGGNGGSVTFVATTIIAPTGRAGAGGASGELWVSAGNGGQGGRGGNVTAVVGNVGLPGTAPTLSEKQARKAVVAFFNGGNGGDSAESSTSGGRGGNVTVSGPNSTLPNLSKLFVGDYANGGNGFNGCGTTPPTNGTNGGNGGSVTVPNTPADIIDTSGRAVSGGDGGDGNPYGTGGAPGDINSAPGTRGTDGKPCAGKTIQPGTYTATPIIDGCGVGQFTLIVTDTKITIPKLGVNVNVTLTFSPDRTSATSDSSNLVLLGSGGDSIKITFTIGPNGTQMTLDGSNPNGGSCVTGGNAK